MVMMMKASHRDDDEDEDEGVGRMRVGRLIGVEGP